MADDRRTESFTYTPQMGNFSTKGTQKTLVMIFVVDISGSMRFGGRIEAVNEAFSKMIPALRDVQIRCMTEFELKIAIMTFDETARWIVAPTPIMEFNFEEIECSQWVTFFSRAFSTLNEKLSRKEYMAHNGKMASPYIMFMTDGEPTPDDIYQPELNKLLDNAWFKSAQRFAVLIGEEAINSAEARKAVEGFVADPREGIINAADAEEIVAEVQAKTLVTVINMTQHKNVIDETGSDGSDSDSENTKTGDGDGTIDFPDDQDFPDFPDFPDFDLLQDSGQNVFL